MFVPTQAQKERAESVRISFPASTMAVLQEMAKDAKTDVSGIIRQAVDYALASRRESKPGRKGRTPARTADNATPQK